MQASDFFRDIKPCPGYATWFEAIDCLNGCLEEAELIDSLIAELEVDKTFKSPIRVGPSEDNVDQLEVYNGMHRAMAYLRTHMKYVYVCEDELDHPSADVIETTIILTETLDDGDFESFMLRMRSFSCEGETDAASHWIESDIVSGCKNIVAMMYYFPFEKIDILKTAIERRLDQLNIKYVEVRTKLFIDDEEEVSI